MSTAGTSIALVDFDATVSHQELLDCAEALTIQANRDLAPMPPYGLGIGGGVTFRAAAPMGLLPHEPVIGLYSRLSIDGALGFHDVAPNGQPLAQVCPEYDRLDGVPWQPTASHEAIELLKDLLCNLAAQASDGMFWADEPCDAVEQDSYLISLPSGHKVPVSNFVLGAWYDASATGKRDHMGLCTHAFEVRPGGYAQWFDPSKGWVLIENFDKAPRAFRRNHKGRAVRRRSRHA